MKVDLKKYSSLRVYRHGQTNKVYTTIAPLEVMYTECASLSKDKDIIYWPGFDGCGDVISNLTQRDEEWWYGIT